MATNARRDLSSGARKFTISHLHVDFKPNMAWLESLSRYDDTADVLIIAGDSRLDEQFRRIDSVLHVYGHQHRNRWRSIDGVLYVSNCLGTPGGCQCPLPASPEAPLKRLW